MQKYERSSSVCIFFLLLSTLTSRSVGAMYHGYQLVLTGSSRAARERLVELTGTTLSVSPLKRAKIHAFFSGCF